MDHVGIDSGRGKVELRFSREDGELIDRRICTVRHRLGELFGGRPKARILVKASTESEWAARCLLGHEVMVADPNYAPVYTQRTRRPSGRAGTGEHARPREREEKGDAPRGGHRPMLSTTGEKSGDTEERAEGEHAAGQDASEKRRIDDLGVRSYLIIPHRSPPDAVTIDYY